MTPGPLMDVKTEIEIEGTKHQRFRVFENLEKAEILAQGKWRGQSIPVRLKPKEGVFLHAYDWTIFPGTVSGAQALPA